MPIIFVRHVDGVGNVAYANDLNELQVAIEQLGLFTYPGDLLVGSSTGWPPNLLQKGVAGQVLTVDGTTGLVTWANPTGTGGGMANPMIAVGDLIKGGTAGAATRLPIGTTGQVLTASGGTAVWANAASGFADPMSTAGDIIVRNASNVTSRLPAGTAGQVLTLAGSPPVPTWGAGSTGLTNPMTTVGDLIVGTTAGAPARIGIGGTGQVLTVSGGTAAWANAASGFANPMTAKGDLIAGGTAGAATRLAVGANGRALLADSTQASGLAWGDPALNPPLIYHYRRSNTSAAGVWSSTTTGFATSMSGTIGPFVNGVTYDVEVLVGVQVSAPSGDYIYCSAGCTAGPTTFTAEIAEGTVGAERVLFVTGSWQVVGDGTTTYTAGLGVRSGNGNTANINAGTARVHCYPRS